MSFVRSRSVHFDSSYEPSERVDEDASTTIGPIYPRLDGSRASYSANVSGTGIDATYGGGDNGEYDNDMVRFSRNLPAESPADYGVSVSDGRMLEYRWNNYTWSRDTNHLPTRHGVVRYDKFLVRYRRRKSNIVHELYSFREGTDTNSGHYVEKEFPYLCGEIVSAEPMASVGGLTNVFTCLDPNVVDMTCVSREEGSKVDSDIQRRRLHAVPLHVDHSNAVLVFRTFKDTLALQLLPSVYTQYRLTPGQPLFSHTHRDVVGCVGNRYSEYSYVVNGAPNAYTMFRVPKGLGDKSDRMFLVVVDRRCYTNTEHRTLDNDGDIASSSSLLTPFTVTGVDGSSVQSIVAGLVNAAFNGGEIDEVTRKQIDTGYKYNHDDLLYVGVVTAGMRLSDSIASVKKNKIPRGAVVVAIDRAGVTAVRVSDGAPVFYWVHKEQNVTYSVLPRNYFEGRNNVIDLNTRSKLRRSKSTERLI